MASNEKNNNPSSPIACAPLRSAAIIVTLAITALAAPVLADPPSTLLANPAGSLTIENIVGPPVVSQSESPEDIAAALEIEQPVPATASSDASKPLGAQTTPIVGAQETETESAAPDGGWGLRTAMALVFVIGLILLSKLVFVRLASRGGGSIAAQLGPSGRAPSGLLSVLARYPIAKGSTLVLLRLDRRVLLLSQTGQGFTTLAEIDDPEEVATLIMRAEDEEGASLTRRFRTMLTQAERDPGLIGEQEFEVESAAPMTPRAATSRFHDLAMDERIVSGSDLVAEPGSDDQADAVGSLRNRLRSMREVTA